MEGTGWHQHVADFHIVIMLKGWARFMYEGEEHLVAPADFETLDVAGPCAVPAPTPWTRLA